MTNNRMKNPRDRRMPVDPIKEQFVANDHIKSPTVRLVDSEGQNLGVKSTRDAINLAYDQELDLVVVSPSATPPVAKICDYGKFIYEQKQNKKEQDRKLRENAIVTKEIQLRPSIGTHDIEVKQNHAKEWLKDNCKIKIVLKFRGREMAHKDRGFAVVNQFLAGLDTCKVEKQPEITANMIIAMIAPNATKTVK
jgi:translation initiation factor IF-3